MRGGLGGPIAALAMHSKSDQRREEVLISPDEFDDCDAGVGAIEIGVGTDGRVALDQYAAFRGVGGKPFPRNDKAGLALLDPETERLADGGAELAALAARAPAVDDLEDGDTGLAGGVEFSDEPAAGLVHAREAGFEIQCAQVGILV
jgi:hypothetical protein